MLLPPADLVNAPVGIRQVGLGFEVRDNDFPEEGQITWAQRDTFVEEGAPAIELRMIRLGRSTSYQSAEIKIPHGLLSIARLYAGSYGYAQPGIHYTGRVDNWMEWGSHDIQSRKSYIELADNDRGGRNWLVMNQVFDHSTGGE